MGDAGDRCGFSGQRDRCAAPPVGLVVIALLARFTRIWPEVLGVSQGIAAVCFLVVALNADYWTCPPIGEVITRTPDSLTVESCGGLNPWPWLIVGLILAVGGAAAYRVAKRLPGMALDGQNQAVE